MVWDFNTLLIAMDRSSRHKIKKETQALNDTLEQIDLSGIYRIFHHKATEYTIFTSAHGTFSRIDHISGHRSSLDISKKIKLSLAFTWSQTYETRNKLQGKKEEKTQTPVS